ncbi:MAG: LUD domain-containing protein [Thermomicrobiales bacterium]
MDHRSDAVISMSDATDLIDHFTSRLASAGGQTHRAANPAEAVETLVILAAGVEVVWTSPTVQAQAPMLVQAMVQAGFDVRVDGDPTSVRDQPLGLTVARHTIAETGSSLLVEPSLAERSVSLMTQTLIVLCRTSDLLIGLDEAAPVLRDVSALGSSYATLVTGPSRTADIERQLTVGVQGPAVFHVILVDVLE